MAIKKATPKTIAPLTLNGRLVTTCTRECSSFAGAGPCPHGVQWGRQTAGATWQSQHRLVGPDGTLGTWQTGACTLKPMELRASLEGRILAHLEAEYPGWDAAMYQAVVKGLAKVLRSELHKRDAWDNRYATEHACDTAGVKKHHASYLLSFLGRKDAPEHAWQVKSPKAA